MIKISAKVVQKLMTTKKMSCFVTFIFIKELFSGNLLEKNIAIIAKQRNLSINTIKEHIQQLIDFGFLEDRSTYSNKGKSWFYVIGNNRFNELNDLEGRDCIVFDDRFDRRLFYFNQLSTEEKLESFKDLKKLRTYLHIALQQLVVTKYLKPTLTREQELEKFLKAEKKKEKAKRLKNKSNLVGQPKESENIVTESKMVSKKESTLKYSVSSSYLTKALGTYQKGFSSSTIRKQQNKAVKKDFLEKQRSFNILACTEEFMEYHLENFYKHNLDFSDTVLTTQKGIVELYDIAEKPEVYSPLFLWVNRGNSKIGEVDALVQEVTPKLSFGCSIGKFAKKKKIKYQDFKKIKYTQVYHEKLTVENLMSCSVFSNEVVSIFDLI